MEAVDGGCLCALPVVVGGCVWAVPVVVGGCMWAVLIIVGASVVAGSPDSEVLVGDSLVVVGAKLLWVPPVWLNEQRKSL